MAQHFKVHTDLSREELDQLEAFAREPGRTIDQCCDWLAAQGWTQISRNAVWRWKREFDVRDRFRASNETARALMDAAKQQGAVAVSDAAMLQLSQMLFEQMLRLQGDGEVSTKELWALSMGIKNVVQGKRQVEKLKGEIAAGVEEAQKLAAGGASGDQIVRRMRELLNV